MAECFANLECKVIDAANRQQIPSLHPRGAQGLDRSTQKSRKTIHHHGYGTFVVDGETIKLKSKMRVISPLNQCPLSEVKRKRCPHKEKSYIQINENEPEAALK